MRKEGSAAGNASSPGLDSDQESPESESTNVHQSFSFVNEKAKFTSDVTRIKTKETFSSEDLRHQKSKTFLICGAGQHGHGAIQEQSYVSHWWFCWTNMLGLKILCCHNRVNCVSCTWNMCWWEASSGAQRKRDRPKMIPVWRGIVNE